MKRSERVALFASLLFVLLFAQVEVASAMHIMEGFLPLGHVIFWWAVSLPFLVFGLYKVSKILKADRRNGIIVAMAAAFTFVLSALKIPSVTGSSSHSTGTGFGAILFGPTPMAVLGAIVLFFQALFLAHGGLTTLGANIFSMAIVGPFIAFGVYKGAIDLRLNRSFAIFIAAMIADLATYCVTSVQLGFAHPSALGGVWASTLEFLSIFAITQIPLAIVEGFLTVIIFMGLETYATPELKALGFLKGESDEA